jgi:hypothetical protein
MPRDRGSARERGECVADHSRVIAEASDAGHLAIGGNPASWDATHDRVDPCVRRRGAGVSALPVRLRAFAPHERDRSIG